jgi:phage shock protein PspC (stress-responsive transcriptional regulator)
MQSTTDDQAGGAGPRRIKRSRDDRMLAGVCGGIARHFGIDPVIVRITTVALVFAGGIGVAPYIAAWILMPADDGSASTIAPTAHAAHA